MGNSDKRQLKFFAIIFFLLISMLTSDTNLKCCSWGSFQSFQKKLEENDDISKPANCLIPAVNQNDFDSCRKVFINNCFALNFRFYGIYDISERL